MFKWHCANTYSERAMGVRRDVERVKHDKVEHAKESLGFEQNLGQGLTFHALAQHIATAGYRRNWITFSENGEIQKINKNTFFILRICSPPPHTAPLVRLYLDKRVRESSQRETAQWKVKFLLQNFYRWWNCVHIVTLNEWNGDYYRRSLGSDRGMKIIEI